MTELPVSAANHYRELKAVASEARNALAAIVVMLGTGSGDPMGTARRHFEALDAILDDEAESHDHLTEVLG